MKTKSLLASVFAAGCAVGATGEAANATCPANGTTPLGSATACVTITLDNTGNGTITEPGFGNIGNPALSLAVFDSPPSEDTLFDVVNNSGQTVNAINISSNLNIFAFDGDGSFSNANGTLTNYNGPLTSFTVNTSTSGVVNFAGGLANGAETFFGLEEDITGATFTVTSVPGPIVGAGFPGLIAACGGFLAWLRRRRQSA